MPAFPLLVSLSRPFEDPVVVFGLAMVVFLVAPLLLQRYRVPGIVGIMVVGAAIGPNALNLLARDDTIVLLGTVGIVYLMFVAGLEIDVNEFAENPDRSVVFGLASFALPMLLGVGIAMAVLGFDLATAALFAAVFASHTLLAYPIVDRLDIVENAAVTTAISGTIITDTLALLVLAVVTRSIDGALDLAFWGGLGIGLVVLFGGVLIVVPRIGRWFFRNVDEESYFEFLFVMALLFVSAVLAEIVGVEAIIGAFLAGLAFNRLIPASGVLMNRIEFVGNALFIPFFLLSVGMLVDVRTFAEGTRSWLVAGVIVGVLFVAKFAAAWGTARIYGYSRGEWLAMFSLTTGQAAATLAITLIGFEIGLFDDAIVNGVVLMIVVVGIASPALTERYGRTIVEAAADAEYDPSEAPERVLVSFTETTENTDLLLDLAIQLRGKSEEPLRALTVVQGRAGDGGTEADVAAAEELLESAASHASGAEVPLDAQTRVDVNVVSGIVSAIEENRITTLVVGWNERPRFGNRVFGSTIEQLRGRTDEFLVVSRLTEPLETMERVALVVPGRLAAHPQFYHGVHVVKELAAELGAPIRCLLVGGDTERYEGLIEGVEPDSPIEVDRFDGTEFDDGDLVVALLPRRDARSWEPPLESLPRRLRDDAPGNVLVAYLSEEPSNPRRFLRIG